MHDHAGTGERKMSRRWTAGRSGRCGDASGGGGAPGAMQVLSSRSTGATSRTWDCCGILMTELTSATSYSYDGTNVTSSSGWSSERHGVPTNTGWYNTSLYSVFTNPIPAASQSQRAHGEWGYQGSFDPSGSRYYNTHENDIFMNGDGSWDCNWYINWRNSLPGWNSQRWCGL